MSNQDNLQLIKLLTELSVGYAFSGALRAAVELGVADALQAGPKSADELAKDVGAQPQLLYRILRALAGKGVFAQDGDRRFRLTPAAEMLCADHPANLREATLMLASDGFMESGIKLLDAVKTGNIPFDRIFGKPFFDYLEQNAAAGHAFHVGMAAFSDSENGPIAESYDFSQFSRIVDVGGGHGGFLVEVLKRHPSVRGVLFDRPDVLSSTDRLSSAGVADRCELAEGDFFTSVTAGGDAYVLKRILHDWDDEKSIRILRNCRDAMADGGKVLVVDAVIVEDNADHFAKAVDLLMMAVLDGCERSRTAFEELFAAAGLAVANIVETPSMLCIVEGTPV